ncbi:MAG: Ig-like domain-containing protein, partial [Alphaproteobacteria bacterium]
MNNGWFDETPPTVVLSGLSAAMNGGETLTAQFSEEIFGFTVGDLSVSNLAVSNFVAIDGDTYNFDVTPISNGAVSVNLPAATVVDAGGFDNEASNTLTGTADITGPTTVIS